MSKTKGGGSTRNGRDGQGMAMKQVNGPSLQGFTLIELLISMAIAGIIAGIIINTGEDNYLTTADAVQKAHTVPVSDFINEQLAFTIGVAHMHYFIRCAD